MRAENSTSNTALPTVVLIGALFVFAALVGYVALGTIGMTAALVVTIVLAGAGAHLPSSLAMRIHGALPLAPREAPELHRIVARLAARGGIEPPRLYLIPSAEANAMATGSADDGALAVTHGLLGLLDRAELEGVLAHEVAHLRNDDTTLRQLAGTLGQSAVTLLQIGTWMTLMLILVGGAGLTKAYQLLLLSLAAPVVINLLITALSRTREFAADATAAELTGKPWALASALGKLSRHRRSWLRLLWPAPSAPPLLRSHPATARRVRRLAQMQQGGAIAEKLVARRPSGPEHRPRLVWTTWPTRQRGWHSWPI